MSTSIAYNGLPSIICAASLIKKGVQVELLLPQELSIKQNGTFNLLPYELPVTGVEHRDYENNLFSFLELNDIKEHLSPEKDIINIVFGSNRIDFSSKTIIEDITRVFPEYERNIRSFITEVLKLEKQLPVLWERGTLLAGSIKLTRIEKVKRVFSFGPKAHKKISYLYKKHDLPECIKLIFDSILFVMSGSIYELPLIEAVRVLAMALEGVNSLEDNVFSFADRMLKSLNCSIKVAGPNEIKEADIKDADFVKKDFILNFNHFNSRYSAQIRYPMSMFFKFDIKNLPAPMSRFLIYIDVDDSGFYSPDDIYVVRYTREDEAAYLRITSFIHSGLFDIESEGHREKLFVMENIVQEIVPALAECGYGRYPDPRSVGLKKGLDNMFANLVENDLIYGKICEESVLPGLGRKVVCCGKERFYSLGFESSVISGLNAANKFFRGSKS